MFFKQVQTKPIKPSCLILWISPFTFDADESLLKEWYIKRFLKFRQSAFTNPDSYFKHYANLSEQEAIETASNIWDNINGLNFKTKHSADS